MNSNQFSNDLLKEATRQVLFVKKKIYENLLFLLMFYGFIFHSNDKKVTALKTHLKVRKIFIQNNLNLENIFHIVLSTVRWLLHIFAYFH